MEWFRKYFIRYTAFLAKSRNILVFALTLSLLLNLVLFLKIPVKTKQDVVHTYSEETIAQLFAENLENDDSLSREELNIGQRQGETHPTYSNKRTKHFRNKPSANVIRQPTTQTSACPRMTIHQDEGPTLNDTVCRPHLPAEDACRYTAEMFEIQPSIAKCHDQKGPPYQLCRVTEIRNGSRLSAPDVTCDVSVCLKTADIRLLIADPSDGNYLQLDIPGTVSNADMQDVVKDAINKTQENGFHFMFLECTGQKKREKISQLLTFLPAESVFKPTGEEFENKVNVNVVLLDSISRPHFFRSLRKTVAYLREKSEDPAYNAHVFDFELFQSIHGHTHENEHALFGGELYPENFTKSDKENSPTNMERLFRIFKDAGYQTMAQNDLCWKAWYGFLTSFMVDDWSELQKIMKETIDSTDGLYLFYTEIRRNFSKYLSSYISVTDTSCRILHRSQRTTSFTDDDEHQICYNGQHQHKYLFDHLTKYLEAVTTLKPSKPLFSFTETNVAHDDVGIRVQTLDQDLTDLIDSVAQLPNTFTIFFADHGNTYTDYQVSMLEGRLEMYHPVMLGILPKELGRKFGKDVVKNLKTNQYRLLHLFDIRESLVELANYDSRTRLNPVGIFREIPKNRTCDDLKLGTPNFCICEGWDIPVENSTARVALAEFAIGQLNNQLQSSLLKSGGSEPAGPLLFGSCQRLRLQSIKNARQRQTAKGTLITTIDVKVQSGTIVDQEELITVQVESAQKANRSSFDMRLLTYNRISHYSIYEQCADKGLPANLCICNKRKTSTKVQNSSIYDIFGPEPKLHKLKPCLLLIKRSYSENNGEEDYVGVEVYELANICENKKFSVRLAAEADNVRASTELPIKVELTPKTVYFATVMMTEVGFMDTKLKLKFRVVSEDVHNEENERKKSGREEGKLGGKWLKPRTNGNEAKWKADTSDKK